MKTRIELACAVSFLAIGTFGIASSAQAAMAQADAPAAAEMEGTGLDDIVVTARRQSENLQRVPIAVTAFDASALATRNINQIIDVARFTPSLTVTQNPYGGLGARVAIRGQQVQDSQLDLTPSVGVYVDDVYQGSTATIGALNAQDVASVEVLKGPQGTLYGRNTTGGALKISTPLPDFEQVSAGGLVGAGNFGIRKIAFNMNVPMAEDVAAFRVSGGLSRSSGYAKNTVLDEPIGSSNVKSLRAALRVKASDDIEVLLRGDYLDGRATAGENDIGYIAPGGALHLTATAARFGFNFTPANLAAAYADLQRFVSPPGRNGEFNVSNRQTVKTQTASGTISWDVSSGLTLKSITAYQHVHTVNICDQDATTEVAVEGNCLEQRFNQFTQELQATGDIGDLNYTVGYFFYRLKGIDLAEVDIFKPLAGIFLINDSTVKDVSNSGYAQLRYTLTPGLRLNGGVRYTSEKVDALVRNRRTVFGVFECNVPTSVRSPAGCFGSFPLKFTNWSYQAGVDADVAQDVLAYATTSRGFKAGGINLRVGAGGNLTPFAPEIATNYELGLKSQLFDRRLRVNLAAFYTKYENIQRTVFVLDNSNNSSSEVRNAASAGLTGFEAEITARPVENLTINASGSYLRAKYKKYIEPATGRDLSNNRFTAIPKWQGSLGFIYTIPTSIGRLSAGADLAYQGKVDFAPDSHLPPSPGLPLGTQPFTIQKGYALLNTRLALAFSDTIEVAAYARNLTNKHYFAEAQDQTGGSGYTRNYYGAPRSYGLVVSFRF